MPLMMHTIIRMCKCGETTTLIIDKWCFKNLIPKVCNKMLYSSDLHYYSSQVDDQCPSPADTCPPKAAPIYVLRVLSQVTAVTQEMQIK